MKNNRILFVLMFFLAGISCRKSYQQQDLKLFSGTWKIEKVEADGISITDYGEIIIDEFGHGKMNLNYAPYDSGSQALQGIFTLVTNSGIDYYVNLDGAYWLNPDGSPGAMMCQQESEVSVRVKDLKKKSMVWEFAETTSIYDCVLREGPGGNMINVKWYLKKQ